MRSPRAGAVRAAVALLVVIALGLGFVPVAVEMPLLPAGESTCHVEPIDVCDAGASDLGVLADLDVLPPARVAVLAAPAVLRAPPERGAPLREGVSTEVYRPPRTAC
ncbi:MAG TPA: hypothetical protein VI078_04480 [bacterium]